MYESPTIEPVGGGNNEVGTSLGVVIYLVAVAIAVITTYAAYMHRAAIVLANDVIAA